MAFVFIIILSPFILLNILFSTVITLGKPEEVSSTTPSKSSSKSTCFNCGEPGCSLADCPHPKDQEHWLLRIYKIQFCVVCVGFAF